MTDSTFDLDKLERLEREATPWPWAGGNAFDIFTDDDAARRGEPGTHIAHTDPSADKEFDKGRADRDLIVALRNAAPALIAELRTLRARVAGAEAERDNTAAALLMIASEVAGDPKIDATDRSDPRWTPTLAHVAEMRARVAELERDARLGQAVRDVAATGGVGSDAPDQLDWYAQSLADDHSMFGAAVIRAIADAIREEMALTCEASPTPDCDCIGCVRLRQRFAELKGGDQ